MDFYLKLPSTWTLDSIPILDLLRMCANMRGMGVPTLKSVSWNHDEVIDMMLADPSIRQNDIARHFRLSATWVSIVVNSDAFKERLRERKAELTDPVLRATIEEKLMGAANSALDRLIGRLDNPVSDMKNQDLIALAKLGVGDRNLTKTQPTTQNNLYVVQLPAQAPNTQSWLNNSSAAKTPLPIAEEIPRGQ